MKYLFTVLTVLFTMSCWGQPILRNPATTNTVPPYVAGTNGFSSGQRLTNSTFAYLTNITDQVYVIVGDRAQATANITSNSTALTGAPSGTFSSSDVGKLILIVRGGLTNPGSATFYDLATTIGAFVSSTAVTLSDAPSNTLTAARIVFGTDKRAEFQTRLNFAATNRYDTTTLISPPGIMVGSTIQDPGIATNHHNSSLFLPPVKVNYGYPTITIKGASKPSGNYLGEGFLGSVITWTMTKSPGTSYTNTVRFFDMNDLTVAQTPSLSTSPKWYSGAQFCRIVLEDFVLEMPHDNGAIGFDCYSALQFNARNIIVASAQAASGVAMRIKTDNRALAIIRPFEASFNEHSTDNCTFYDVFGGMSCVGLTTDNSPTFYGVSHAYTSFNAPQLVTINSPAFMECSNCFYIPASASLLASVNSPMQINTAAVPFWDDYGVNNFFVYSEDGGAIISYSDYGYYNALLQTNIPPVSNGSIAPRVRVKGDTFSGDTVKYVTGTRRFTDQIYSDAEISSSKGLYGDVTIKDLTVPLVTDNGALVPQIFSLTASQYGYRFLSNTWNRLHYQMIPINLSFTNRPFQTLQFQVAMTNIGVTAWQVGYMCIGTNGDVFSTRASPNLFATNLVNADQLIMLQWQDNVAIPATARAISPFILWWGQVGGSPFPATNHAALITGKMIFSQTSGLTH